MMQSNAGICCLMVLLLFCGSCSGCTINNSIEASGGFYTDNNSNELPADSSPI